MLSRRNPDRNSFIIFILFILFFYTNVFGETCFVAFHLLLIMYFMQWNKVRILHLNNELHMFILHFLFLPRINITLSDIKDLYNGHRKPNPDNSLSSNCLDNSIESEFYGEDSSALFPLHRITITIPQNRKYFFRKEFIHVYRVSVKNIFIHRYHKISRNHY